MKELRLLFTGVGRRVELMQAFRQAALYINTKIIIFGADCSETAPALSYCDYFRKVCRMNDPNYISELKAVCENDNIDIVIPTIDTDLLVLSENAHLFGRTKILVSAPDKIAICRDKNLTAAFFESCGCLTPKTVNNYKKYDGTYPCFIKPKDGSSSINAFKVNSLDELKRYANQMSDYVIQPFIEGTEYTVDVFCDFNGNPLCITPRVRMQVRAGEVLKTQISLDDNIVAECKVIISRFKPVGPITIQLIRDNIKGIDYFIEINPRYGGGAPLSMKAGANSAVLLLKIMLQEQIRITVDDSVCDGAIFSRFDQSVCISFGRNRLPVKGVIFDLDDTLYNEIDYVKSGFKAIAKYLGDDNAYDLLMDFFHKGLPAIDYLLNSIDRVELKDECLEVYRNHYPDISLHDGVRDLIMKLRQDGIKVGIITDGRPQGQHNKLSALGLDKIIDDIIVTDELGGEQFRKPCDISFRIMQRRWRLPFEQMIYIGDNLAKDFQAPNQLGMRHILINNKNGLYSNSEGISIVKVAECLNELTIVQ